MSETRAVPLERVTRGNRERPLCPSCFVGRLHPFVVDIYLGGFRGFDYATGWIAKCNGATNEETDAGPVEPCGFSMSIIPNKL